MLDAVLEDISLTFTTRLGVLLGAKLGAIDGFLIIHITCILLQR